MTIRVLQMIILFYGIEFLWTKSGALIGYFGFGPQYEVVFSRFYHIGYYDG